MTSRRQNTKVTFNSQMVLLVAADSNDFVRALGMVGNGTMLESMQGTGFIGELSGMDGDAVNDTTTAIMSFTADVGPLSAGTYNLTLGKFFNHKESVAERS